MRTLRRELPLQPKVTFEPRLRRRRNHGHEQRARRDLPANLRIPYIAADQLALIEPHFDSGRAERFANAPRRLGVLRGVGKENCSRCVAHTRMRLPVRRQEWDIFPIGAKFRCIRRTKR